MSLSGILALCSVAFIIVSVLLFSFPNKDSSNKVKTIFGVCGIISLVISIALFVGGFFFLAQEREVEIAQQEAQLAEYTATFEEFISEQFNGTIPNELLNFNTAMTTVSPTQDFYVLLRVWWEENTDLCYSRMVGFIRNGNIDLWQFINLAPTPAE